MALRTYAANRPVLDPDGFFHGAIAAIKPIPSTDRYKAPRYKWTIEGRGSIRPVGYSFTTSSELGNGTELLTDVIDVDREEGEEWGEGDDLPGYNTLAQVCLALQLVTPADLADDRLDQTIQELDLEKALGFSVKVRLAQRSMVTTERGIQRKTAYIAPILDTLSLD